MITTSNECSSVSAEMKFLSWLEDAHRQFPEQTINMIREGVQLSGECQIQLVTSSLITSQFMWETNQLIIEVLGSAPGSKQIKVVNSSRHWFGNNIRIIGVLRSGFLAIYDCEGSIADVLYIDFDTGDTELIEHWDLSPFWMRSALILDPVDDRPQFGCVVSKDESEALVTGPAFIGTWGSRVMDLRKKRFIKDITLEHYSWIAAAAYHTKPGHQTLVAVICMQKFEFIMNHARPNKTGTLLLYDTSTGVVLAKLSSHQACSEVLKFSQDGSYLITRINDEQCLAVMDSMDLVILKMFPHNCHCFPYSYHILYPLFPLLSNCTTKIAILEWCEKSGEPDVYIFDLPRKMTTLKNLTRIAIIQALRCVRDVEVLPLPQKVKLFLQW